MQGRQLSDKGRTAMRTEMQPVLSEKSADRQNRGSIKVNIYRASTENGDITMGVFLDVTRAGHILFTEYVTCHVQAGIFQISETVELFSQQQYYGG